MIQGQAEVLFCELRRRGFALEAAPTGALNVTGPRLTPEDRESIRTHKAELLRLLALLDDERLADFQPDFGTGSVQCREVALVNVFGRTVAVGAVEHAETCRFFEEWNRLSLTWAEKQREERKRKKKRKQKRRKKQA